jgi:hypothetical protein
MYDRVNRSEVSMNRIWGLIGFVASVQLALASLVPVGPVPLSGQGLGNVNTALTFTSPASSTTESGCVGAGVGGVTITGSTKCPPGFTGGNEQAVNSTYSAASLGLQNFADLQIIFNASEPGNAADQSITVNNLALTLWNPLNGNLLATYTIASPYFIADAFQGVGNAGFGFNLDAAQSNAANLLLDANAGLFLGIAANASAATGGLETVSIRTTGATPRGGQGPGQQEIPEPATMISTTIGLCGLTLLSMLARRARVRQKP